MRSSDFSSDVCSSDLVGLEAVRDEGVERIYADRRAVRQILLNLLSNAIKFTAQNGTVRVAVGQAEKGGYCEITVQDTGIGIPKRALNRLGYTFEVVDARFSLGKGGSGLGLAWSKALHEQIESRSGKERVDRELK